MRAVELKVQTFGSRQDKQRIDFSHVDEKAYFFITEPKAAHKITLIDAICFSLYGKAPLQDHIVHLLKNSEITYTFWLHQQKYLVTRRPKRKKLIATVERYTEVAASANLQCWNQKDEWNLLHSNIKDVNEAIEKMIGLNYHQFKRMILSPPDEFQQLISRSSTEREEILQKIFDTYFYKNKTTAIKDNIKTLKEKRKTLEGQWNQENKNSSIDCLDEHTDNEIKAQLEDQLTKLTEQKIKLSSHLEKVSRQFTILKDKYHQTKLNELEEEYQTLNILKKDYEQYKNVVHKLHIERDMQKKKCDRLKQERESHVLSQLAVITEGKACPVCGSLYHSHLESYQEQTPSEAIIEKEMKKLTTLDEETKEMEKILSHIRISNDKKNLLFSQLLRNTTIGGDQLTNAWKNDIQAILQKKDELITKQQIINVQTEQLVGTIQRISDLELQMKDINKEYKHMVKMATVAREVIRQEFYINPDIVT